MGEELVRIACRIVRRRARTVLVDNGTLPLPLPLDGKQKLIELPRGAIRPNRDGTITMPLWLAKDRGLA